MRVMDTSRERKARPRGPDAVLYGTHDVAHVHSQGRSADATAHATPGARRSDMTRGGHDEHKSPDREMRRPLPRRFYKSVTVNAGSRADDRFGILLDGKAVRTPAKGVLGVPTG